MATPPFRADEGGRMHALFAALLESAVGTPRRFAAVRRFGRDRSEAESAGSESI
jgi:hypothetical protein